MKEVQLFIIVNKSLFRLRHTQFQGRFPLQHSRCLLCSRHRRGIGVCVICRKYTVHQPHILTGEDRCFGVLAYKRKERWPFGSNHNPSITIAGITDSRNNMIGWFMLGIVEFHLVIRILFLKKLPFLFEVLTSLITQKTVVNHTYHFFPLGKYLLCLL